LSNAITVLAFAPFVLSLVVGILLVRRNERRRAERFAELAGLRRLPGESNRSLMDRAARRFGAGLGLTIGGRK